VVEQGLQLPPAFATDYSHPSCPPDDLKGYDHPPDLNSEGSSRAPDALEEACRRGPTVPLVSYLASEFRYTE